MPKIRKCYEKILCYLIVVLTFISLNSFANDEQLATDELKDINFQNGVTASSNCHSYYVLGELLFDLKANGYPKNTIPEIRNVVGNKFVDSILNYATDKRDTLKEMQFLDNDYDNCLVK
ncbi:MULTISPECIES: hypothetical protein [unclassified Gilliamella]|uniref:hypothetical protein n=1 Tax=unclassified Gilliamella TaxID=2685620 RepID=UPI000A34769D|nr:MULTISPECIES: hypothetical protein [unclassified Gilliamella]OTQ75539.1 hypothetical protein B6C99_00455 [Gilliamella sp. N-G2]OTQ80655.1 hypothetical protein B6D23_00945 [Gilliamella sp. N-W3]